VKGAVLFSATLQPIEYYIDTLGGDKASDPRIILPSPFPRENFRLLVAPKVSVKYKNRDSSYQEVASYIESFVRNKIGNYFIYSPSYEYMTKLVPHLKLDGYDYFVQTKEMSEEDREAFLLNFKPDPEKTTIGFLVLGGAFSEGIDLVKDRLIGAVIIGIGLPKVNFESDKIAEYYVSKELPGRDYAYTNPGMNKVMQAVGRVIRSETDRGAVLLLEQRYLSQQYQELYRIEWEDYQVVLSPEEVSDNLSKFFEE
jgi:DNA excision repair protein ERCC-2